MIRENYTLTILKRHTIRNISFMLCAAHNGHLFDAFSLEPSKWFEPTARTFMATPNLHLTNGTTQQLTDRCIFVWQTCASGLQCTFGPLVHEGPKRRAGFLLGRPVWSALRPSGARPVSRLEAPRSRCRQRPCFHKVLRQTSPSE